MLTPLPAVVSASLVLLGSLPRPLRGGVAFPGAEQPRFGPEPTPRRCCVDWCTSGLGLHPVHSLSLQKARRRAWARSLPGLLAQGPCGPRRGWGWAQSWGHRPTCPRGAGGSPVNTGSAVRPGDCSPSLAQASPGGDVSPPALSRSRSSAGSRWGQGRRAEACHQAGSPAGHPRSSGKPRSGPPLHRSRAPGHRGAWDLWAFGGLFCPALGHSHRQTSCLRCHLGRPGALLPAPWPLPSSHIQTDPVTTLGETADHSSAQRREGLSPPAVTSAGTGRGQTVPCGERRQHLGQLPGRFSDAPQRTGLRCTTL